MRRPFAIRLAAVAAAWLTFVLAPHSDTFAQSQRVVRADDGFVLAIPAGWTERKDLGATAGIAPVAGTEAYLTVQVQHEPARAPVSDVLARVVTKMKTSGGAEVVSSRFGTFLKRRAVLAELRDESARYRVIVIPRDAGETSQDYYTLIAWCAATSFTRLQPAFDNALAGFDVTASATPAAAAAAAATPTAQGARSAAPASPEARAAFFARILNPQPGPTVAAPVANDKNQQKLFDGAEFYRKGLVFATQGAWTEAQQAFREAEKKNDKDPEYILATAFAYLKLHKANESQKRYQDLYKKDPTHKRALVGLIASAEEIQNYRDATKLWQRYLTMPLPATEATEARSLFRGAQDLFADRYEITENPAGGAANIATPQEELALGLEYAKSLSASGVPLVTDPEILSYVEQLCQNLVDHAKQFPSNYQLFVLDTAQVNATTTPGFIFVYRGILDASDTEAALAGVLAHEIGHSVAHHIGKSATKSVQDQQQIANLKNSNSKLSQFLGKMMESGNGVSARSFSRDNEAQADRLAVHIAFDSGFDPAAIADLFQKFEQMSPTSRNTWDQMMRSHPPSIDRINTVKEYASLLPDRPTKKNSPAFDRMKKRLAALPPPPDATGMLKSATPAASPMPSSTTTPRADTSRMRTTAFSLNPLPFSGEVPEGWTGSKISNTFFVFRGPAGTGSNEAGVHFEVMAKAAYPGKTIQDILALEQAAVLKYPGGAVAGTDGGRTNDGRPMLMLQTTYTCTTSARIETVCQRLTGLVEFPDYFVFVKYVAPKAAWADFSYAYEIAGNSLTYGLNRTAPVPPPAPTPPAAPAPAPPRTTPPPTPAPAKTTGTFSVQIAPYAGQMPAGWTSREEKGVVTIEGAKGTEAYAMSVRLFFYDKSSGIDAIASEMRDALNQQPDARITELANRATEEGLALRGLLAEFTCKITGQPGPCKEIIAIVDYPKNVVMLQYYGPTSLYDKYFDAFTLVGSTLKGRQGPFDRPRP